MDSLTNPELTHGQFDKSWTVMDSLTCPELTHGQFDKSWTNCHGQFDKSWTVMDSLTNPELTLMVPGSATKGQNRAASQVKSAPLWGCAGLRHESALLLGWQQGCVTSQVGSISHSIRWEWSPDTRLIMAQTSDRFWWVFVLHFLNLSSTSLWGVYSHNMHPSSTVMPAFTLITISFPEALVHILNHVTATHSVLNVCHMLIQCNYSFIMCVCVNVNVCVCLPACVCVVCH